MSMYDDLVAGNLSEADPRKTETGFADNMQAGLGLFIDENMSVSEGMHLGGVPYAGEGLVGERNRAIIEARRAGEIEDDAWDTYTSWKPYGEKIDFEGLTNYMRSVKGRDDLLPYDKLYENMRDGLKVRREYAQGVFESQTGMGLAGELVGTAWGASLDPVNVLGGFAMGARAFSGYSSLQKVGVAFGVGMSTEAIIQPQVYQWKQAIGSEYSTGEALTNIIAAGGFNAAAEGVALGLKAMITKGYNISTRGKDPREMTEQDYLELANSMSPGQIKAFKDTEAAEAVLSPLIRELESVPFSPIRTDTFSEGEIWFKGAKDQYRITSVDETGKLAKVRFIMRDGSMGEDEFTVHMDAEKGNGWTRKTELVDPVTHANMVDEADIAANKFTLKPSDEPVIEMEDSALDEAFNTMITDQPDFVMDVDSAGNTLKASDFVKQIDDQEKRLTGLLGCLRGQ